MLLALPAELRLRIYAYTLNFEGTLHRPLKASAWKDFSGSLADISLIFTNKQIYREAKDVFWELNAFRVSYNHMCSCQNAFPYPAFNENLIRKLEIRSFLPRIEEEAATCCYCKDSGLGLVHYLQGLPKLQDASIAFEDIFTFSDCLPPMLKALGTSKAAMLASDAVGCISIGGLGGLKLEMHLPALYRAWQHLALGKAAKSQGRFPGQKIIGRALEYLSFEANAYNRTAMSLRPFFIDIGDMDELKLRFKCLQDGRRRRAEFTIALAGELSKIFEDDGGADSIEWTALDVPPVLHATPQFIPWDFTAECDVQRTPETGVLQVQITNMMAGTD